MPSDLDQNLMPFITMDEFEEMSDLVKTIEMPFVFYTIEDIQKEIEPELNESLPFAMKLTQQPAQTTREKEARSYLLNLLNLIIIFD